MASNAAPKTILLSGDPLCYEAIANTSGILPGHLLALNSSGKAIVHPTAAGVSGRLFAREEEYVGGDITTAYASADTVPYYSCRPGDRVYALLPASAAAVVKGDYLESAGDGTLRKSTHAVTSATTASAWPVAIALESVDNSAGGSAVRIKVEVL